MHGFLYETIHTGKIVIYRKNQFKKNYTPENNCVCGKIFKKRRVVTSNQSGNQRNYIPETSACQQAKLLGKFIGFWCYLQITLKIFNWITLCLTAILVVWYMVYDSCVMASCLSFSLQQKSDTIYVCHHKGKCIKIIPSYNSCNERL